MRLIYKQIIVSISILFLTHLSYARDVVLIDNLASTADGELLQSVLMKKFHIPKELIKIKKVSESCQLPKAIIHLCLLQNGELKVVRINTYVLNNSFGIFLDQANSMEMN